MDVRSDSLNLISICTGGAGLDLGVELAVPSARSVCMVEREAFGAARLASAMEDGLLAPAPIWSDARTFAGRRWRGCVDGVISGIPCQPHSLAGARKGGADDRDLWSTARRIVVQSGAWWVLIENVGGMLSSSSPDLRPGAERVWRDLQRMGFAVEGGLFTAAEVGAPHERERVFILGVADPLGFGRWPEGHCDLLTETAFACGGGMVDAASIRRGEGWTKSVVRRGRPTPDIPGGSMANASRHYRRCGERAEKTGARPNGVGRRRFAGGGDSVADGPIWPPRPNNSEGWRRLLAQQPEVEPAICRNAYGLATRVDELRMLGNGVVPLEAAYALRTLALRLSARSAGAVELCRLMNLQSHDHREAA